MASEAKARKKANDLLAALPNYHPYLPIEDINAALTAAGFNEMEPAIYCGREGRAIEKVGDRTFLAMSWYRMETGRYEIVAYVS